MIFLFDKVADVNRSDPEGVAALLNASGSDKVALG